MKQIRVKKQGTKRTKPTQSIDRRSPSGKEHKN